MAVPGARFPILRTADCSKLRSQNGLSIAVLLACYTGAFDQPEDCLAEEMLRAPQGPVAVIGGSRVTMPYGIAVLGTEFLQTY
ncbi:MAG: C25 family cysteine peptidase [Pirellulales bacterium]